MSTTKNVISTRSKNVILKKLREGVEVNPANAKEQENLEFAKLVLTAEKFVSDYKKEHGNKAFLCERLRAGYIGEIVHADNGASYIQSIRGKPYGTVVALKTNDNIVLGISYLDEEDMNTGHPIIGLYIALKRAIDGLKAGKIGAEKKYIKSKDRKQIEHFEKRSLAFFHPEIYSYSRGQEGKKVVYENYDEIHERRAKILGK